jgi:outer membrane biosynthesis protein TonB
MKALQVGILVALVVCAGLLFKVYQGQQASPAPAAVPAQSTAALPAAAMPAPAAETQAASQPAPAAQPAVVRERRPSPTRTVKSKAPETVAESRPAAAPAPTAPAPTPASAPAEPQPDPARAALNPPAGTETAPPPPRVPHSVTIPAGTLISVRLAETLSSEKNTSGDAFSATLDQPLVIDGFAVAERGARVRGKIVEADRAGRIKGVAMLSLALTSLHTADGQNVDLTTESFVK